MNITQLCKHLQQLERDGFGELEVLAIESWSGDHAPVTGIMVDAEASPPAALVDTDRAAHLDLTVHVQPKKKAPR